MTYENKQDERHLAQQLLLIEEIVKNLNSAVLVSLNTKKSTVKSLDDVASIFGALEIAIATFAVTSFLKIGTNSNFPIDSFERLKRYLHVAQLQSAQKRDDRATVCPAQKEVRKT